MGEGDQLDERMDGRKEWKWIVVVRWTAVTVLDHFWSFTYEFAVDLEN